MTYRAETVLTTFVAVLVLQSRVGDRDDSLIVDHQVRIVRAANAAGSCANRTPRAVRASYKGRVSISPRTGA